MLQCKSAYKKLIIADLLIIDIERDNEFSLTSSTLAVSDLI